jgi:hypothetical protein
MVAEVNRTLGIFVIEAIGKRRLLMEFQTSRNFQLNRTHLKDY